MREIALGSRNRAKIKAAENAARKLMGASKVTSVDVDGGFDQPMSTEQGREGARRRAERALEEREADVGVGVEGFVEQIKAKMFLSTGLSSLTVKTTARGAQVCIRFHRSSRRDSQKMSSLK